MDQKITHLKSLNLQLICSTESLDRKHTNLLSSQIFSTKSTGKKKRYDADILAEKMILLESQPSSKLLTTLGEATKGRYRNQNLWATVNFKVDKQIQKKEISKPKFQEIQLNQRSFIRSVEKIKIPEQIKQFMKSKLLSRSQLGPKQFQTNEIVKLSPMIKENPYSNTDVQRTASQVSKKRKETKNSNSQELVPKHGRTALMVQILQNQLLPITNTQLLKFQIINGNNSRLVKKVLLLTRTDQWFETPATVDSTISNIRTQISHFHFRWAPTSKGINFERLSTNLFSQVVNHYEGHSEITTKNKLFKNVRAWHDERNEPVFRDMLPLTFCLKINTYDGEIEKHSLRNELKEFKQVFKLLKQFSDIEIDSKKPGQVYGLSDGQNFKCKQPLVMPLSHFQGRNIWILKPTGLNRGKGIHVVGSIKELKRMIKLNCAENSQKLTQPMPVLKRKNNGFQSQFEVPIKMLTTKMPEQKTFVVQKYIERPWLINKRKFDIRVWVLLDHNMDTYFFREGYLRTSCCPYGVDKLDDDFVHLTNNAVQKNNPKYGQLEDGNQLSFADFRKFLKQDPIYQERGVDFDKDILPKMKYQAAVTMLSARKKMNQLKRKYCFELFGFDYIIDGDLNVWLIEANTNPCLEESSKLLEVLLPRMIDDMFKLTVDKIFVPPGGRSPTDVQFGSNLINSVLKQRKPSERKQVEVIDERPSPFKVPGYKDTFNIWEKIIETGKYLQRPTNEIQIAKPPDLYRKDDNLIHLVGPNEMRVFRASLAEKFVTKAQENQ